MVLSYRVGPYKHPVPLWDAQRAVRLVRYFAAQWGVLSNKIALLGFSAGGHLTAHAGTTFDNGNENAQDEIDKQSCRPDAILPCYAVLSAAEFGHRSSFQFLTGEENPSEERLRALSPDRLVTPQTPPAFLWHTAADDLVPVENSLSFAMALSRNKVPFALHVFPEGPHGIGLASDYPLAKQWPHLACEWLLQLGF